MIAHLSEILGLDKLIFSLIELHNAQYEQGLQTYQQGITFLADLVIVQGGFQRIFNNSIDNIRVRQAKIP